MAQAYLISQESVCVAPSIRWCLGSAGCQYLPMVGQHCVRAAYQRRMCLSLQLRDLHAMLPYLKHLKFLKSLDMRYRTCACLLLAAVEHISESLPSTFQMQFVSGVIDYLAGTDQLACRQNPLSQEHNYRLHMIHHLPNLHVLDRHQASQPLALSGDAGPSCPLPRICSVTALRRHESLCHGRSVPAGDR